MTPTQAQIDAAVKAMREHSICGELYYDENYQEAAKAALTAAAEVGPERDLHALAKIAAAENENERLKVAATIERCAEVAEGCSQYKDGYRQIAAAIRAIKDKPDAK